MAGFRIGKLKNSWLVIVAVAIITVLLISAIVGALFWADVISFGTTDSTVTTANIENSLEADDHVLIKSATMNETKVRELNYHHQNNYESIVNATKHWKNFSTHLDNLYIKRITVWRPFAGLKMTFNNVFDVHVAFLKRDMAVLYDESIGTTIFIDMEKMILYSDENHSNLFDYKNFHLFYSYKEFKSKKEWLLNCMATYNLLEKKDAKLVIFSGRLEALPRISIDSEKKNYFEEKIANEFTISWTEFFRRSVEKLIAQTTRVENIGVANNASTSLLKNNTMFFMKWTKKFLERLFYDYISYKCAEDQDHAITLSWLPSQRIYLRKFEKTKLIILCEERLTNASFIKLEDDFITEQFHFEPMKNVIWMENLQSGMKNDRNRSVVQIWDAKYGEIGVNYSGLSMTCYRNDSTFTISKNALSLKTRDDEIFINDSEIVFWKNDSLCGMAIDLKEFKIKNKTCEFGDGYSAKLNISDVQLRASHGNATLLLIRTPTQIQLETMVGNATQSVGKTELNCGWATAQLTRNLFPFQLWHAEKVKANVSEAIEGEPKSFLPTDSITVNSERVNFSISRMRTTISTIHGEITIIPHF